MFLCEIYLYNILHKLSCVSTAEATVNYFKEEIEEELLTTGDKLPSEQALQHQLGIIRFSLREGLA